MVSVSCDKEDCPRYDIEMDHTDTDSRAEWTEFIYECPECGKRKIHRTEYTQDGLVESDEVYDES